MRQNDEYSVRIEVDGEPSILLSKTVLEISEAPRERAVWAIDVYGDGAGAFVVCPEGHHIRDGVAPANPRAWCFRCQHVYEIET